MDRNHDFDQYSPSNTKAVGNHILFIIISCYYASFLHALNKGFYRFSFYLGLYHVGYYVLFRLFIILASPVPCCNLIFVT